MITTLIADSESRTVQTLTQHLNTYCPQVKIEGVASSNQEVCEFLQDLQPELVFIEMGLASKKVQSVFQETSMEVEAILLHSDSCKNADIPEFHGNGHLAKPVQAREVAMAVHQAQHWLQLKKEWRKCRQLLAHLHGQSPPNDRMGIPTMEGLEFLKAGEILRCEGLQRLTRVVTVEGASIISSYNIGAFGEFLSRYGFFSPHRSHLINLRYVRKYHLEGTIFMTDGSSVPVSRRRKRLFLEQVKSL
ncbi:MAG: response regulator transcription factor [Saprospiraceae bacterium]|nr:response regulator transcription factor [Saprospiraceae bacterium]